ncbi:hypothetical protein BDR04DRAFT_1122078 [Suillus decipiens]|nr:hypothetical protein BDR04DRAFT_1122078 [Suillus decipiens]
MALGKKNYLMVELLQEEMRRVLAFLEWQMEWWEDHASPRMWLDGIENEGSHPSSNAYAVLYKNIVLYESTFKKPLVCGLCVKNYPRLRNTKGRKHQGALEGEGIGSPAEYAYKKHGGLLPSSINTPTKVWHIGHLPKGKYCKYWKMQYCQHNKDFPVTNFGQMTSGSNQYPVASLSKGCH